MNDYEGKHTIVCAFLQMCSTVLLVAIYTVWEVVKFRFVLFLFIVFCQADIGHVSRVPSFKFT